MRRSHLGLAALASILVLVLVLAAGCGGSSSNAAPAGPAGPPQLTLVAGGDGYLVYPDDTGLRQIFAGFDIQVLDGGRGLFWSPSGRYVAFVAENPDAPGNSDLFVLDTAVPGAEPRNVTQRVLEDSFEGVAFIGNRHVAVIVWDSHGSDRILYALDVTDPDPEPIDLSTDLNGGDVYAWASSPDGRRLAFVSYDGDDDSIHVVEAGSLVRHQALIVEDTEFDTPVWSADGRLLAAWAPYYSRAGYVIDVSDPSEPEPYWVADALEEDVYEMAWSGSGHSLALEGDDTLYLIDASDPSNLAEPANYAEIDLDGAEPYSLAWSHDGRYLALVIDDDSDDSVFVVDAADLGSAATLVTSFSAYPVDWQLSWSAAGPYLAIGTGNTVGLGGPMALRVADLADLASPVVHDLGAIVGSPAGLHSWSADGAYLAFVSRDTGTGNGTLQVLAAGSDAPTALADALEILASDPTPVWRPRTP